MTPNLNASQQRGGGAVKGLIALAIFASLILAGLRIIPVYIDAYAFRDAMRSQAKFAGVERKSPEQIREELYKKAQELELPITREQIQVSAQQHGVAIVARFSIPVDLIAYQTTLNFDYSADTRTAY